MIQNILAKALKVFLKIFSNIIWGLGFLTLLILSIIVYFMSASIPKSVKIQENSIIFINDKAFEQVKDIPVANVLEMVMGINKVMPMILLENILLKALGDPKIKGLMIDLSSISVDLVSQERLIKIIKKFKLAGKNVMTYYDYASFNNYLIAAAGNLACANPHGDLFIGGIGIGSLFYKKLFDRILFHMDVIRVGKNKSYVEPYIKSQFSTSVKREFAQILRSIMNLQANEIAKMRDLSAAQVWSLIDGVGMFNGLDAVKSGLIDCALYRLQWIEFCQKYYQFFCNAGDKSHRKSELQDLLQIFEKNNGSTDALFTMLKKEDEERIELLKRLKKTIEEKETKEVKTSTGAKKAKALKELKEFEKKKINAESKNAFSKDQHPTCHIVPFFAYANGEIVKTIKNIGADNNRQADFVVCVSGTKEKQIADKKAATDDIVMNEKTDIGAADNNAIKTKVKNLSAEKLKAAKLNAAKGKPINNKIKKLKIARICLSGEFNFDSPSKNVISFDKVIRLLAKIEKARCFNAVIIVMNSSGGIASVGLDILSALKSFKISSGIKIYFLVNDVAASAGYLSMMAADKIFAHPKSIIGSMGIFAMKPAIKDTLAKIGVTHDSVISGDRANSRSLFHKCNDLERKILQDRIDSMYDLFLQAVHKNRKIPLKTLRKIADGSSWSGKDSLKYNLIDGVGGYDQMIGAICQDFGVNYLEIKDISEPIDWRLLMLQVVFSKIISHGDVGDLSAKIKSFFLNKNHNFNVMQAKTDMPLPS